MPEGKKDPPDIVSKGVSTRVKAVFSIEYSGTEEWNPKATRISRGKRWPRERSCLDFIYNATILEEDGLNYFDINIPRVSRRETQRFEAVESVGRIPLPS